MNSTQKEVIGVSLKDEQRTIRELKQVYAQAMKDCEAKIRELSGRTDLENITSIVYQKQYQEALKKQLDGICDTLQGQQFKTVADYIQKSYVNGYTGVMYDLHKQGIPITTPINQKQVAAAIQVDSKISTSLYTQLGEDVRKLKTSIRSELSRGAANGASWNEIAGKIAKGMNSPFDASFRRTRLIARTEGHRVQQKAALDAQYAAKDKGADVVKQWCATLDDVTRPEHQQLDGQIRELDEDFEVGGYSGAYPGGFGDPYMDCNCRCCVLQRARWALDQDELDTLRDRAAFFGLDKTDSFQEFQEKYLNLPDNADTMEVPKGIMDATDYAGLKQYLSDQYSINVDISVEKLDFSTVQKTLAGMESTFSDYPELADKITTISTKDRGVMCCNGKEIFFNPKYYTDVSGFEAMCKNCSSSGWWPANSTPTSIGVHETGHAVESLLLNLSDYEYDWQRILAWNKGEMSGSIVSQAVKNIKKTAYGKGKKQVDLMRAVSGYAATKKQETFAEAFADVCSNGENANPLSIEIKRLAMEKYKELKGK